MSQEHEKPSPSDTPESTGLRLEAAPFEPGYQPGSLPQITVPDLPEDAEGLSAEALAQVPTLTELVHEETDLGEEVNSEVPIEGSEDKVTAEATDLVAAEEPIQEPPVQADTWTEVMHARMGKLTDDIHTLNARLDRLEEIIKTEV